jgi:glycerol-3-phosphate cytidylyltransferase
VLAALACVDYVTIFGEDTPIETILALRPHIHVKGGDYRPDDLPEVGAVREVGARVEIFPLVPGRSSSSLIEKALGSRPS